MQDEKKRSILDVIDETKELVESRETESEKIDRLEKSTAMYEKASLELDRLNEELTLSPEEEKDAKREEIKKFKELTLTKELQILKESLNVLKERSERNLADSLGSMGCSSDEIEEDASEDDYDDPFEKKKFALMKLIETTKEIVEAEETAKEKASRLDRTKIILVEASKRIDRLSEEMDSSELSEDEKISKGDELIEIELTALQKECDILDECFKVVSKRIEQRRTDARQDLSQSLKDTFSRYLVSLNETHFQNLILALEGNKDDLANYRDLMIGVVNKFAEREKESEVIDGLGTLKPFANSRHYWNGFNELFIKPFAAIHEDSKSFHHFISLEIEAAKRMRAKEKSRKKISWVIIISIALALFLLLMD